MADNRERGRASEPDEAPARVVTAEEAAQQRQRQIARELSQSAGGARDETVPGGRYLNGSGDLVNANGEPLKRDKGD